MEPTSEWKDKLAKIEGFRQRVPSDGAMSTERTETYLGYDDRNLYVIFACFDSQPKLVRARLSRREDVFDDDFVEVMLDTFDDHRRAYAFFVNPMGVQADSLWTEGPDEELNFDFSFDTVWNSAGKVTDQGYLAWMEIPFRSLRFSSSDPKTWGLLLERKGVLAAIFQPNHGASQPGRYCDGDGAHCLGKKFAAHSLRNLPVIQGTRSARPQCSVLFAACGIWTNWIGCQGRH